MSQPTFARECFCVATEVLLVIHWNPGLLYGTALTAWICSCLEHQLREKIIFAFTLSCIRLNTQGWGWSFCMRLSMSYAVHKGSGLGARGVRGPLCIRLNTQGMGLVQNKFSGPCPRASQCLSCPRGLPGPRALS